MVDLGYVRIVLSMVGDLPVYFKDLGTIDHFDVLSMDKVFAGPGFVSTTTYSFHTPGQGGSPVPLLGQRGVFWVPLFVVYTPTTST